MLLGLLCVEGRSSFASEDPSSSLELGRFGLYFTAYFQPDDSNSRSALFLYSPTVRLDDRLSLITDLGATYLNTPDSKFFALFFSERFDFRFTKSFSADLNAGIQHWTKEAGISPMAGVGFAYHVEKSVFPLVDTFRIAGERVWEKDYSTWQILAGVEIHFGDCGKEVKAQPIRSTLPLDSAPLPPPPDFTVTLTAENLSFARGKSTLSPAGKNYVESVAKAFAQYDSVWSQISITGHTDNSGPAEINTKLSLDRANAVASLFVKQGIDSARLKIRGAGPDEPLAGNDTPSGRSRNRRVELGVVADPKTSGELSAKIDEINKAQQPGAISQ